jgi:hypothetical protein
MKKAAWMLCEECGDLSFGVKPACACASPLGTRLDVEDPVTFADMEALRNCAETGDWTEASKLLVKRWFEKESK